MFDIASAIVFNWTRTSYVHYDAPIECDVCSECIRECSR